MISIQLRRFAMARQAETGVSLQDILREIVRAARDGKIAYGQINYCTLCGSKCTRVIVTKRLDAIILRTHKCDFCNNVFRSEQAEEIAASQRLEERPRPIAKQKKKRHIKDRGG